MAADAGFLGSEVTRLPRPGEHLGQFEIVRLLGRGGMGAVFEAKQGEARRALKLILSPDQEALARFQREGEALARVDRHANIVAVHGFGVHESLPFLILDYVDGGSLDARLQSGPLAIEEALEICAQIGDALHSVHSAGILHRDLKPANILMAEDGRPLLSDFGLARVLGERSLTATREIVGTPHYMAPEQVEGRTEEISPATDIWALGAILYELVTGERPFSHPAAMGLARAILFDEPAAPSSFVPGLAQELDAIVLRAMSKHPGDRQASAADFAADCRRVIAGEPLGYGARPTLWQRARRSAGRHRRALAYLSVIGVLLFVGVAGFGYARARRLEREQAKRLMSQATKTLKQKVARAWKPLDLHCGLHFRAAIQGRQTSQDCENTVDAQSELLHAEESFANWKLLSNDKSSIRAAEDALAGLRAQIAFLDDLETVARGDEIRTSLKRDLAPEILTALQLLQQKRPKDAAAALDTLASSTGPVAEAASLGRVMSLMAAKDWTRAQRAFGRLRRVPETESLYAELEIRLTEGLLVMGIFSGDASKLSPREKLRKLTASYEATDWARLNRSLAEEFERQRRQGEIRRSATLLGFELVEELHYEVPGLELLVVDANFHAELARDATAKGRSDHALHHWIRAKTLDPDFVVPEEFSPERQDGNDVLIQIQRGERQAALGRLLEVTRAGALLNVMQIAFIAEKEARILAEMAARFPNDRALLFLTAMQRPPDYEIHERDPTEWHRLGKLTVEKLNVILSDASLSELFRGLALMRRARFHGEFMHKMELPELAPKIREDLEAALQLKLNMPEEPYFELFSRLGDKPSTDSAEVFAWLDRYEQLIRERRRRTLEKTLGEGYPPYSPRSGLSETSFVDELARTDRKRAQVFLRMGETEKAIACLRKATRIHPASGETMEMLGGVLIKQKKFAEVEALLKRHRVDKDGIKWKRLEQKLRDAREQAKGEQ